ncbi:MAG TPA: hypothetical protein VGJ25_14670 [Gaiellaceae bacterium]|jgi:hypothetical protein
MPVDVADIVRCGCGYVLWGEDEESLLEAAERHVRNAHPELVGTLSPLELARPAVEDAAAA